MSSPFVRVGSRAVCEACEHRFDVESAMIRRPSLSAVEADRQFAALFGRSPSPPAAAEPQPSKPPANSPPTTIAPTPPPAREASTPAPTTEDPAPTAQAPAPTTEDAAPQVRVAAGNPGYALRLGVIVALILAGTFAAVGLWYLWQTNRELQQVKLTQTQALPREARSD